MTEIEALVKYDITDAAIQAMEDEYTGLTITDKDSYEVIRKALGVLRGHRTAVDKRRLELTKKARDYQDEVNSAGKAIISSLLEIEKPLKAEKKKEDDKEAAIEAEKKRLDDERISKIMARITAISDLNSPEIINMESVELEIIRDTLIDLEIKGEEFEEHSEHAERIKANVLAVIQKAYDERVVYEAAAVKAKEEAGRLAEEKKAQAIKDKELAEREAELAKKEAEIKAEEDRKVQEKRDAEVKEEARIEAKEYAKNILEKQVRDAEEKAETDKAEAARQEGLKPDKEKLEAFAEFLIKIEGPDMKSQEAVIVLSRALCGLEDIIADLKSDIENL